MAKKQKVKIEEGMTLYDVNKQLISQYQPYDAIMLMKKIEEIYDDFWEIHNPYQYVMLLCRDIYDITVFHTPNVSSLPKENLRATLSARGEVLSIEKQDNGSYEIWIRLAQDKQVYCYYLFNCEELIVKC